MWARARAKKPPPLACQWMCSTHSTSWIRASCSRWCRTSFLPSAWWSSRSEQVGCKRFPSRSCWLTSGNSSRILYKTYPTRWLSRERSSLITFSTTPNKKIPLWLCRRSYRSYFPYLGKFPHQHYCNCEMRLTWWWSSRWPTAPTRRSPWSISCLWSCCARSLQHRKGPSFRFSTTYIPKFK